LLGSTAGSEKTEREDTDGCEFLAEHATDPARPCAARAA
jgi:hypothetical protein